jgi:broad specificity phosphatase PhoE
MSKSSKLEDKNIYIWIRHGEKQYDNGKGKVGNYQHDCPLKEDINESIYTKVETLYRLYGFPSRIICSPFLRTRQTKDIMLIKLKEIDKRSTESIKIQYDTYISEFLGFQKPVGEIADIEPETASHFKSKILLGETLKNLNYRVKTHIRELNLLFPSDYKVTWIITHGIILSNVYHNLSRKFFYPRELPSRPQPLAYVRFSHSMKDGIKELDHNL